MHLTHSSSSSSSGNDDGFHVFGGKEHQALTEIVPYKAPGPPPKTGKHRYVFVALAPANGTTERLNLSKPRSRQRWGFDGEGEGLREWARENGLGVVGEFLCFCFGMCIVEADLDGLGANFVYAQNKKQ